MPTAVNGQLVSDSCQAAGTLLSSYPRGAYTSVLLGPDGHPIDWQQHSGRLARSLQLMAVAGVLNKPTASGQQPCVSLEASGIDTGASTLKHRTRPAQASAADVIMSQHICCTVAVVEDDQGFSSALTHKHMNDMHDTAMCTDHVTNLTSAGQSWQQPVGNSPPWHHTNSTSTMSAASLMSAGHTFRTSVSE